MPELRVLSANYPPSVKLVRLVLDPNKHSNRGYTVFEQHALGKVVTDLDWLFEYWVDTVVASNFLMVDFEKLGTQPVCLRLMLSLEIA
jgi:hypothetical protein